VLNNEAKFGSLHNRLNEQPGQIPGVNDMLEKILKSVSENE
jgi:DNA-binding FrmR family transcriptional regulator